MNSLNCKVHFLAKSSYNRYATLIEHGSIIVIKNILLDTISIDKNICHGKPRIKGTRIMVQQILDLLTAGAAPEEIIRNDFPDITREDIQVCVAFANQLVQFHNSC